MKKIIVLLAKQQVPFLTYLTDIDVRIGDVVSVPFRNCVTLGMVWAFEEEKLKHKFELKQIYQLHEIFSIKTEFINFIKIFSKYYMIDPSSICKMVLQIKISDLEKLKPHKIYESFSLPNLSQEQQDSLKQINSVNIPSLLHGVTGSGKTEIYFHLAKEHMEKGGQVLILMPEIGLTNQIIERFHNAFGFAPEIWHSSISAAKKRDAYLNIISGNSKALIGTRSSLFIPFKNLSLIIIDEEHDPSYKQEELTLYNARDAAILIAKCMNIKALLVSATPSLESMNNALIGRFQYIELNSRFKGAKLPDVHIVDMKAEKKGEWISAPLRVAIQDAISQGQQTILYINRRGYAPLVLCRTCSFRFACNNCSSWLVYHAKNNNLVCHHCGYNTKKPDNCPECSNDSLVMSGPGIERVAEEAEASFKNARICSFSKDSAPSNDDVQNLIKSIENNEYDIIVGTQIITKGYHFPKVTVVGVIDADLGAANIDLKANERSLQILSQVSGRAGRADDEGNVYIQTYYPDNPIFQTLKNHNQKEFYKLEIESRSNFNLPPFSRAVALIITGDEEMQTFSFAKKVKSVFFESEKVKILGPAPASMSKLKGNYRFRILILADKNIDVQKYISSHIEQIKIGKFSIRIEVDPYSFY